MVMEQPTRRQGTTLNSDKPTVEEIEHEDGTVQYVCSLCGYSSSNRNRTRGHVSAGHRRIGVPAPVEPETISLGSITATLDELGRELMRLRAFEAAVLAAVSSNGQ